VERLWSPWRLAYVTATDRPGECIFCDAAAARPDEGLVLFRGTACYVILNLYPYNNGHLMVVPNRHFGSLAEARAEELLELIDLTRRAEMALTEAYTPQGLNVGINLGRAAGAGVLDHLHVHLVPRWVGDTNFMTAVGGARVLPEDLRDTVTRLRPVFERLGREAGPGILAATSTDNSQGGSP
jgi:ATP adenylyltransferase